MPTKASPKWWASRAAGSLWAASSPTHSVPALCRKRGKLPGDTRTQTYSKEYGEDVIEIHTDAFSPNDVVLIHDDLLATGGSMKAAIDLVESFGVKKIYVNFLIELRMEGLEGREFLGNKAELTTLLTLYN